MTNIASGILSVTKSVTKKWTRQRKAEERSLRGLFSRAEIFDDRRLSFTELAEEVLPRAHEHASGGGKYTVSKRQLFYACRKEFKRWTGRELDADYFSNTLLVQYINRHPFAASWKITADPRGTLTIPNADHEVRIPCGTLAIEKYLQNVSESVELADLEAGVPTPWPSLRHGQRYQAVLYVEKEGFEPLLKEARIAERHDLAILSCKGQSVVAARRFVDEVCRVDGGVPLLVVHDFDKAGFEISQRLTSVSARAEENDRVAYYFKNKIDVTDLGLRLSDVQQYRLGSEAVKFKGRFAADSLATPEEQAFLRSGRRVELNAFTSPQFIEWLTTRLNDRGLGKRLVPDDRVLEAAFRRALAVARLNQGIDGATAEAVHLAASSKMPKTLKRQLLKLMKKWPEESWDAALYRLAQDELGKRDDN